MGGKAIGNIYRKLSPEDKVVFLEWVNRLNKKRLELLVGED